MAMKKKASDMNKNPKMDKKPMMDKKMPMMPKMSMMDKMDKMFAKAIPGVGMPKKAKAKKVKK